MQKEYELDILLCLTNITIHIYPLYEAKLLHTTLILSFKLYLCPTFTSSLSIFLSLIESFVFNHPLTDNTQNNSGISEIYGTG